MYTHNFPEKVRLRREGALKRLSKIVSGLSKKARPRTQEQLDHERAVLTEAVKGGPHYGERSKKDHSSKAKVR